MSEPWVAVERAKRMRETWLAVDPTRAEIAAARAKMARARGAHRGRRVLPLAVASAIVFAAVAAFAGVRSGVLRRVLGSMHAAAPEAPAAGTGAPMAGSAARPVTKPTTTTASVPSSEPAAIDPETLPIAMDPAPPAAVRAVGSGSTVATSPATAPSTGGWVAAAEAMRTGDYGAADRAFGDLTASPDARTRDEARLARAQVWVAQGRTAEARRELEQLAVSGATPLVRSRAADMMRSLGSGSPDRAGPGTNTP